MSAMIHFWNCDKKHRCPQCHAIAIDLEKPSGWKVYTCCRCGEKFCRFPRLARFLPKAGIMCGEHRAADGSRNG